MQGRVKHYWVLVLMIQEAHDIIIFPHLNNCVSGYSESAEIPTEEKGRAGETAANIHCSEL